MSARATAADFAAARARVQPGYRPPVTEPPATPETGRMRPRVRRARTDDEVRANMANPVRSGKPRGSQLPADVQEWVRAELAAGASLNALANALGVTRDRIRVVRDGYNVRGACYRAARKVAA